MIVQRLSESVQRIADSALTDTKTICGAGNAAFVPDGGKDCEQSQIDLLPISGHNTPITTIKLTMLIEANQI
jgi:hypothetical protein